MKLSINMSVDFHVSTVTKVSAFFASILFTSVIYILYDSIMLEVTI